MRLGHILTFVFACFFAGMAHAENQHASSVAEQLGWVPTKQGVCQGYYEDPLSAYAGIQLPPLNKTATEINADETRLYQEGTSTVAGHVVISQTGRLLHADEAHFVREANQSKINQIKIQGHVKVQEPDRLFLADQGYVDLHQDSGYLKDVLYRIQLYLSPLLNKNLPLHAWGKANQVKQIHKNLIELQQVTYTTCPPTTHTWQLSAKNISLNRATGTGDAYNAWMYYHDVPVFYMPYWHFPIDQRRKTGFLFPSINYSSQSGGIFSIPFYWNIATNYDLLFTPEIYTKRGIQFNGTVRYLEHTGQGSITASFLPDDRAFGEFKSQSLLSYPSTTLGLDTLLVQNNRSSVTWEDQRRWGQRWSSRINYSWVGDDYYLADFSRPFVLTSNQLLQEGNLNYTGDHWYLATEIKNYQTLHPINQVAVGNPYNHLPEIDFNGAYPDQAYGLNYELTNQIVYFQRPLNPGEQLSAPSAIRLNIQPSVSWPFLEAAGYFTPRVQLAMTSYSLNNQLPGLSSQIQRVIPIVDVDSGLYFNRTLPQSSYFGHYQQTLEPRLFYLYVPYVKQSSIPLFDSGLNQFTYDNLFNNNRFTSYDRIGDANQISYALTTRFIDNRSGAEKLRASVGQILYFQNRRVNLCGPVDLATNSAPGTTCANPEAVPGLTSPTEIISPIAGLLNYQINPHWSITANAAWDPTEHVAIDGSMNLQYHPQTNHLININYNFIRFGDIISSSQMPGAPPVPATSSQNNFNRIGFSFAWPLLSRWNTVGGLTYSISRSYPQTYFYGLEYQSCCWAFRITAGRDFYALDQNNAPQFSSIIYLEWQLKGLGSLGTSNTNSFTNFLESNIPGYRDNFSAPAKLA